MLQLEFEGRGVPDRAHFAWSYKNEGTTCHLMCLVSTLGKIFCRQHIEIFYLFLPENRIRHFMQIVSIGDNLHEMSYPFFLEKNRKNIINLSSAEIA